MPEGRVVAFDEARGLGEVEANPEGSGERYPFHCTALIDGTRSIRVGERVTFRVVAGPIGTTEAASISPTPARTRAGAG
jgi:cold shock CspA family protein